jgi:hypothetical protein
VGCLDGARGVVGKRGKRGSEQAGKREGVRSVHRVVGKSYGQEFPNGLEKPSGNP